jgi:GntR family transcriptional repressor for pyruvate dehydrogenase complex
MAHDVSSPSACQTREERVQDPTIGPIERRKVYELVADRLIAELGNDLKPGDVLPPERTLMTRYGVGRSSIREALRMLESRGLIESRFTGTFVVAPSTTPLNRSLDLLLAAREGGLGKLFEVRRILEGEAAALAAERRSDAHLAALNAAIEEMADVLDSEAAYIAADVQFHLTVAQATDNPVIVHLMHAIRDQLKAAFGTVYHIPGSAERSLAQHREIAAAIALRKPAEARSLMHAHIDRVEAEFVG